LERNYKFRRAGNDIPYAAVISVLIIFNIRNPVLRLKERHQTFKRPSIGIGTSYAKISINSD
jgi:hypothetical protein